MIELWQTEWCPSSHRVRERLTELGIDCVIRQVPVRQEERVALERAAGCTTIPVLIADGGETIVGEEQILLWLDDQFAEPESAAEHRAKAEKALRRLIDEQLEKEAA